MPTTDKHCQLDVRRTWSTKLPNTNHFNFLPGNFVDNLKTTLFGWEAYFHDQNYF